MSGFSRMAGDEPAQGGDMGEKVRSSGATGAVGQGSASEVQSASGRRDAGLALSPEARAVLEE